MFRYSLLISTALCALAFSSPSAAQEASEGDEAQRGDIVVTGARTSDEIGIGVLGQRSLLDTPLSATGYTEAMILDQGARSASEVLANDPSIRLQGAGDGNYDYFSIRGFTISASAFAMNGLYGVLPWNTFSPETVGRFEVVRGPSTTFTGASPFDNPGGSINIQPKRAGGTPLTQFTGSADLDGQLGIHGDVGRRFGEGDAWGVRVNAAYRKGGQARDHQSEEVALGAIGLDYKGERVRLSFDAGHQFFRTDGASFLFYIDPGTDVPHAPETNNNPSPEWAFARSRDTYFAGRAEYDLADYVTLYAAAGTRDHNRQRKSTLPMPPQPPGDMSQPDILSISGLGKSTRATCAGLA